MVIIYLKREKLRLFLSKTTEEKGFGKFILSLNSFLNGIINFMILYTVSSETHTKAFR